MKIDSLKELKKLLQLCHEQGVHSIKLDGMEFGLNPTIPVKTKKSIIDNINLEEDIKIPQYTPVVRDGEPDAIAMPDELTEEQLLNWSSQSVNN